MAGTGDNSNTNLGLTEREVEILKHAWTCMKTTPEIDFPKLAEACGMTNTGSASNAWAKIKKKLFSDLPAPSPKAPKTPKTATGNKRKKSMPAADGDSANLDGADDDELALVATPTKKPRTKKAATPKAATPKAAATPKGKKGKAAKKDSDEEDDDEVDYDAKDGVDKESSKHDSDSDDAAVKKEPAPYSNGAFTADNDDIVE